VEPSSNEPPRLAPNLSAPKPLARTVQSLWQISGYSDTSYDRRVELDVKYVRNMSLTRDLRIPAKPWLVLCAGDGSSVVTLVIEFRRLPARPWLRYRPRGGLAGSNPQAPSEKLHGRYLDTNGAPAGKARAAFGACDIISCSAALPNDPAVLTIKNRFAEDVTQNTDDENEPAFRASVELS
jgi:hypothetical protein